MTDDREGILGNLPRSRPGVRSDKRAAGKRPRAAPAPRQAAPKPPPAPPPPASPSGGAIEVAVRAAGQVAETGIKVAARVAGGVLRRLPLP
jgi:hypothetical protein